MDVWFDSGSTHAAVLQDRVPSSTAPPTSIWRAATSTAAGSSPPC